MQTKAFWCKPLLGLNRLLLNLFKCNTVSAKDQVFPALDMQFFVFQNIRCADIFCPIIHQKFYKQKQPLKGVLSKIF